MTRSSLHQYRSPYDSVEFTAVSGSYHHSIELTAVSWSYYDSIEITSTADDSIEPTTSSIVVRMARRNVIERGALGTPLRRPGEAPIFV